MDFVVTPARVGRALIGATLLLIAGYVVTRVFLLMGHQRLFNLIPLLDLNRERSIPTWFSSVVLLGGAVTVALIAAQVRHKGLPFFAHWVGLTIGFALLSAEEVAGLHEMTALPIRTALGTSGLLFYAWILPFSAIVVLILLAYLRFLAHLPRRTTGMFLGAGALYVGGSMGMEAVGGMLHERDGIETPWYLLAVLIEESMEMLGAALFAIASLEFLAGLGFDARFRVAHHESSIEEAPQSPVSVTLSLDGVRRPTAAARSTAT